MDATRFVTDASLERLARRLRFLGYDVVTLRGARLPELFEFAAREGRTVLSLSAQHPRRWAHVSLRQVTRGDEPAALRAIAASHAPSSPPFRRCARCNTALVARSSFEARGEIPGRVLRAGGPLTYCPGCGRWYWLGSHVAHIRRTLEAALGRPIAERSDAPPDQG